MDQTKIKIRDFRNKQFFVIDDEYMNGYARLCGWQATLTYNSLCRHANKDQYSFPSVKLMAEENGVSQRTIIRGIKALEDWNIIRVSRSRTKGGTFKSNGYDLLDKSEWKSKSNNEQYVHMPHSPHAPQSHGQPHAPQSLDQVTDSHYKDTHIKDTHKEIYKEKIKDDISKDKNNDKLEKFCHDFTELFNSVMKKKYRAIPPSAFKNVQYWLGVYSEEDVFEAVGKIPLHSFWRDKMSPMIFFRRFNPNKDPVDYIGEFLNIPRPKSWKERIIEEENMLREQYLKGKNENKD